MHITITHTFVISDKISFITLVYTHLAYNKCIPSKGISLILETLACNTDLSLFSLARYPCQDIWITFHSLTCSEMMINKNMRVSTNPEYNLF